MDSQAVRLTKTETLDGAEVTDGGVLSRSSRLNVVARVLVGNRAVHLVGGLKLGLSGVLYLMGFNARTVLVGGREGNTKCWGGIKC